MTDPALLRSLRWVMWGGFCLALALAAYWLLFTTFMIYDDEGYVLLSLRNFSTYGGLYDKVYTQYGPFPYLWYDALHRLIGFAYNNSSGRWITLVNWLATSVACALMIQRATRSSLAGILTLAATFTYVWVMIHEPSHPGSLITLVVAAATWLAWEAWRAGRTLAFVVITGTASSLLLLTKINVGVFFAAASVGWLIFNTASLRARRAGAWAFAVGCALLPLVLMHSLAQEQWVSTFALVFYSGCLGILMVMRHCSVRAVGARHWVLFGGCLAAVTLGICAWAMQSGSSLHGLIDGILLSPLRHPGVYSFPVKWSVGTVPLALLSLVVATCSLRNGLCRAAWLVETLAWARLVAAVMAVAVPLCFGQRSFAPWSLSYGLSLAWMFAVPLNKRADGAPLGPWLALVLIFHALQAYPVAGSQLNWGTFLWIPLVMWGVHDAIPSLGARLCRPVWAGRAAATIAALLALHITQKMFNIGRVNFFSSQPLGLNGAADLRLPNDITYALRIVDGNLRAHADLLFSFPGLYSANLWTDLPTPTLANTTHWFSLLSQAQQQAIVDQLASHPRAVVLVQRELLEFLDDHGFPQQGLLHGWLMTHFAKAVGFGGYELWVHRDRSIAPLWLAEPRFRADGSMDALTLTLRSLRAPIARVELCDVDRPETALFTFSAENTRLTLTPSGLDGRSTGSPAATTFPARGDEGSRLELRFRSLNLGGSARRLLLVLRDSEGRSLGELLLTDLPQPSASERTAGQERTDEPRR